VAAEGFDHSMNRFKHSGFPKARRRVSVRSALFLIMIAFGVVMLCSSMRVLLPGMGAGFSLALSALATVAGFGMPAYLGICLIDGDQRRMVPMHALGRAQILHLTSLGVLFVCPASLATDMLSALLARMGFAQAAASSAPGLGLFLPALIQSVLLAPVCEELFFRGYLVGALRPYGQRSAVLAAAAAFALIHDLSPALAAHFALGCLLALMMVKTGSILAPMLIHASYNFTVLVLAFSGLERFVTGSGIFACLLRLLGCAAFALALKRAYALRMQRAVVQLQGKTAFSRREKALLIAAGIALLAAMIVSGVTA